MWHGDPVAPVILGVTTILAFAIIGRIGARKLGQPTVLGELLMGILLGNIAWYLGFDLIAVLREGSRVFDVVDQALLGVPIEQSASALFGETRGLEIARIVTGPQGGQVMQVAQAVDVFSRYGVIFLLFMVGLRTNLDELRSVGGDAIRVALIGVIAPVALGYGVAALIRPDLQFSTALFVAATLAATSIGITANVLSETGADKSREGHIILGAAVCDDILGLIILAIVSGIVVSGSVHMPDVVRVASVSTLFLVAVIKLGPAIIRLTAKIMRQLDIVEAKMFTSYLFVMVLAWAANLVGLATIIGAFSAGPVRDGARLGGEPRRPGDDHRCVFGRHRAVRPVLPRTRGRRQCVRQHPRTHHAAGSDPGAHLFHPHGHPGKDRVLPVLAGRPVCGRIARRGSDRQVSERPGRLQGDGAHGHRAGNAATGRGRARLRVHRPHLGGDR
jgi:Kef-type K+ transport system membrane component KefB